MASLVRLTRGDPHGAKLIMTSQQQLAACPPSSVRPLSTGESREWTTCGLAIAAFAISSIIRARGSDAAAMQGLLKPIDVLDVANTAVTTTAFRAKSWPVVVASRTNPVPAIGRRAGSGRPPPGRPLRSQTRTRETASVVKDRVSHLHRANVSSFFICRAP